MTMNELYVLLTHHFPEETGEVVGHLPRSEFERALARLDEIDGSNGR